MEYFWPIFWGAIGTLITSLIGWLSTYLVGLINSKIKDQKLRTFLTKFTELMISCVNALTQTTVEQLKKDGKFDAEAAKHVKETCIKSIKNQLAPDMIEFIRSNYGDVTEYISTQIEGYLFQNKK